jgi:ankyrin repeat protein
MNRFDPELQRVLLAAVEAGDRAAAARAVEAGARVSLPAVDGGTPPLVAAARRRDAPMVSWLLEQGAFAGATAGYAEPESALAAAFRNGDAAIANLILDRMDYFGPEHFSEAAVALARGPNDDIESLRHLVARCPRQPLLSEYHASQVLDMAAANGHLAIIRFLIEQGPKPTTVAPAARGGHVEVLRLLASRGASINSADAATGETPLHAAIQAPQNVEATVEVLLRLGCRTNGRDRDNKTPSARARAIGRTDLAGLISTLAPKCGPRWMRQARTSGVSTCSVYQSRAFGLGFDPHDIERPILWGGDYDGSWPVTAAEGLANWKGAQKASSSACQETRWFLPFMEKLAAGEEFDLAELKAANPRVRFEPEPPETSESERVMS